MGEGQITKIKHTQIGGSYMTYFDMDGTLADLKNVKDVWRRLDNGDVHVYAEAGALPWCDVARNMKDVGIITWGSRTAPCDMMSYIYKYNWLVEHGIAFDRFIFIDYGTPKSNYMCAGDIIIDDDVKVCAEVRAHGYMAMEA